MQNCAVSNRGLLEGCSETSRPEAEVVMSALRLWWFKNTGIAEWFKHFALTHIYSCFDSWLVSIQPLWLLQKKNKALGHSNCRRPGATNLAKVIFLIANCWPTNIGWGPSFIFVPGLLSGFGSWAERLMHLLGWAGQKTGLKNLMGLESATLKVGKSHRTVPTTS